mmetsp:Transcript_31318/g.38772  ORF Transcript_31318/g.38772 Transcript_31318/m.38772 type:complete len:87 (-) Transcript_31318:110-370(-)|eukprot:CAMPEP_0170455104 /NCGR_PEP_ID=MMETSP0123-20130129/3154_1 /TAXON_ID=182087 /ORGANISM="Favella ehrenbergii, Strain Fehren 1" /LENGTH=86 /DNA_ID=CAMNT_0010718079 /DNA_START=715 /DNA_END=975 /DNA_ORIENTATION=-
MSLSIIFPGVILMAMDRARLTPKNQALNLGFNLGLCCLELYVSVPMGLAMYSRQGTISASELEEEYRGIRDKQGTLVSEFVFNKGL